MKGLGRSAALLGMSGAASLILTLGPGLGIAHAIDDNGGNRNDNRGCNILDGNKDRRDGRDGKDGLDNKDDGLNNNDWFNWDDKNKDNKDNRRDGDCIIGAGVGVGVGVVGAGVGAGAGAGVGAGAGGGAPAGGVGAGGGGMAGDSTPLLPLAGAGLGAILLTAGVATRRRGQGAS